MRTGHDYLVRFVRIDLVAQTRKFPLAIVGTGGAKMTPPQAGRGRRRLITISEFNEAFIFFAARLQVIEDEDAHTAGAATYPAIFAEELAALFKPRFDFDEIVSQVRRIEPPKNTRVAKSLPKNLDYRMTPTFNIMGLAETLFRTEVLGRPVESMKFLEPAAVFARELFLFHMIPRSMQPALDHARVAVAAE